MGVLILAIVLLVFFKKFWRPIRKALVKPEFKGKLVWITGASSGIGEELTKRFASLGATVILSSRNEKELNRVKNLCTNSDSHIIFPLDMSKPQEVMQKSTEFVKKLESEGKKLDIVIENAGNSQRSLFAETDYENHEYITQLNYNGPVAHAKSYINHMIKNKNGQIVTVSSLAGKVGAGLRSSYGGAKHAVGGFFDSVRAEVDQHNVGVTQIFPGYVQTNVSKNALTGKAGEKLGKTDANIAAGIPVDVFGDDAIFSIYTRENEYVATNELKQSVGVMLRNILPDTVFKLMAKNVKQQLDALKKAE